MILHFAYGANMNRAVMQKHAPNAQPIGVAALRNHRFVITATGYASVEERRNVTVCGVLWRLTPHDRITLDVWENVAAGLYRAEVLPVCHAGQRRMALTYVAQARSSGRAKPGYMELVIAAALEWRLPHTYIASLRRFLPRHSGDANPPKIEEFGWT